MKRFAMILGSIAATIILTVLILMAFNYATYEYPPSHGVAYRFGGYSTTGSYESYDMAESAPSVAEGPGFAYREKIIRSGSATVATTDILSTSDQLRTMVDGYDGYIKSESVTQGDDPYGYLSIAIPSKRLDAFIAELKESFDVQAHALSTDDRTVEYVRLEDRIAVLNEQIAAIEEIGRDEAIAVEDRIAIQSQLAEYRLQLKSLEESLSDIDELVDYSEVRITLKSPQAIRGEEYWWRNTMQAALSAFQMMARVLIVLAVILAPIAVVAIPAFLLWRTLKNKKWPTAEYVEEGVADSIDVE